MQRETASDSESQSKRATAWAACIVLMAATAIADMATGPYVRLDFFYLLPALIASRWIGRNTGMAFAFLCAALSITAQVLTGHPFSEHPLMAAWAGLMRFGTWGVAVWLVSERQQYVRRMESLVAELRRAMSEIKQLKGLLPVCAWCKRMRTEKGTWLRLEEYLQETTAASVTHGMCPECAAAQTEKIEKTRG